MLPDHSITRGGLLHRARCACAMSLATDVTHMSQCSEFLARPESRPENAFNFIEHCARWGRDGLSKTAPTARGVGGWGWRSGPRLWGQRQSYCSKTSVVPALNFRYLGPLRAASSFLSFAPFSFLSPDFSLFSLFFDRFFVFAPSAGFLTAVPGRQVHRAPPRVGRPQLALVQPDQEASRDRSGSTAGGAQVHSRLRSPKTLSMRLTGHQYLSPDIPAGKQPSVRE